MPRKLQYALAAFIVALIAGAPFAYSRYQGRHVRAFHAVEEGVLYRSGQMSLSGLKSVIQEYRIKTVITLRDAEVPGTPPPDLDEQEFCIKEEINHVRITPQPWGASDGSVPAMKGVARFLEVMKDPKNYPVLIHCFAGVHRTGAHCAVYRMEHNRWSNERAIAEVIEHGYDNLATELDLLSFLESYVPSWGK